MGRKIICPECNTVFDEDVLKAKNSENTCLVCGADLGGKTNSEEEHSDWVTWWYYGFKSDNGKTASLRDKPIDLNEHGDTYFLIKEFKAPPENNPGGLEAVKDVLRTYIPGAFEFPAPPTPQIRCPRCFSTEFQLVPRKFSLLTGFATNKFDRVCNHCGKRF